MGRFIAATMRWISFLLVLSPALVFGATYEETRNVVDSAEKKFKCTYKLNYNNKGVFSKAKSTATCTPKKNGKVVEETFDIKEIGKSVTVKHTIKKGKKTITSISVKDYVAPTTTAASAPAPDMTHDCTCKMSPDSQGNFMTAVRSAVPAVVNRQLFGGGLGGGLLSNLGNLPGAAAPAAAPAPGGLDLGSLLAGGAAGGSNDLVTNLAMQVAQQQINDFINNGGAEDAITNLVESGQLEDMVMNFVESGQAEQLIGQMMENVDMEQIVGQAMENVDMEEMMGQMTESLEEQMAENMENGEFGPLGEMLQSLESLEMNGGLEELMANMEENMQGGLMGPEMLAQLGNMQLNMKCSCTHIA